MKIKRKVKKQEGENSKERQGLVSLRSERNVGKEHV